MHDSPAATPETEALTGRVTEFVGIGDTVRRPATESSASVRQLLTHLEHAGFDGAPHFFGTEPDGSMVPSWVEGRMPADAEYWRLGRSELALVGELLGPYHDCVAGFAPGIGFAEGPRRCAMWDLAHAVRQFAPVCDDADPWLGGWPSPPDRSARIAALVGGYRLGAERADELADMVVVDGCARSSPTLPRVRAPAS